MGGGCPLGFASHSLLSAGHPPSPSAPFPEGQVDSLLSIISSQRERFRARNQELEGVRGLCGSCVLPWAACLPCGVCHQHSTSASSGKYTFKGQWDQDLSVLLIRAVQIPAAAVRVRWLSCLAIQHSTGAAG